MKLCYSLFTLLLAASPAIAADWNVDAAKSHLTFTARQTGAPFQGSFAKWTAQISYDPAHPEAAHIKAIIDMSSAKTGDSQRDSSLPQPDWFNVKIFPQASFEATGFTPKGGNQFEAPGKLTIRGISHDAMLPFTLTITGSNAEAKGHLTLIRTQYGVGQGPWADGDNVGLEVGVDVDVVASETK